MDAGSLLLSLFALASAPALATDVLVIHAVPSQAYADDVVSKLEATLRFTNVDAWNGAIATPSVLDPLAYDAVFIMPDSTFQNGIALGDNLAAYVDQGGGVVDSVFSVNWGNLYVAGTWLTSGYRPFEGTDQAFTFDTVVVNDPASPLLSGFSTISFAGGVYRGLTPVLYPGATLVASWSDGAVMLAAHQPTGAGYVVGLNAYMPSSDVASFGWQSSTDGATLMANALEYAATGNTTASSTLLASSGGSCPGASAIGVTGATPRGTVAFVTGTPLGTSAIPVGPCAGTWVPLGTPALRGTSRATAGGTVDISFNAGAGLCGVSFFAVDLATCRVSQVATLP